MARKVLVGMLLLAALFIFGLATFYVENWQFYLGRGYRLTARFTAAQTLDTGDLVRLAGVAVGTVEELRVHTETPTDYPVEAVLFIRRGVSIRADDRAIIRMSTLFGGTYVDIERGDPEAQALENTDELAKTAVAPSITQVVEESTQTLERVSAVFDDVGAITEEIRRGEGVLGRLIHDEELYKQLRTAVMDGQETVASLRTTAQRLEEGQGLLGKLIMDEKMAEDFSALTAEAHGTAANLRAMSDDLREGRGTIGRLLHDEELYDRLTDSVGTLEQTARALREGDGLVPRLLDDPQLADDFQTFTASMRRISERLDHGEGTLGKLMTSAEAYEKLNASLDDLNAVTAAISRGEGTLGKLMTDDELYGKLSRIAEDLQAMLDTYREQSPVISFAGAVFGAF